MRNAIDHTLGNVNDHRVGNVSDHGWGMVVTLDTLQELIPAVYRLCMRQKQCKYGRRYDDAVDDEPAKLHVQEIRKAISISLKCLVIFGHLMWSKPAFCDITTESVSSLIGLKLSIALGDNLNIDSKDGNFLIDMTTQMNILLM